MNNIIQQISEKLTKKILEKAYSGGICDIDLLSSSVLETASQQQEISLRRSSPT